MFLAQISFKLSKICQPFTFNSLNLFEIFPRQTVSTSIVHEESVIRLKNYEHSGCALLVTNWPQMSDDSVLH